jgi:uncharacterized protein involved in type VI secretion and phage assembly
MRRYPGVVTGIVHGEPDVDGRVVLEFPWLDKAYRSHPAPIAMPMAGRQRGAFFMPEPEDEVLVAFEQGDLDHPFVVGFLWNGVDTPPETTHRNRVIKTPGGHTLRFEDTDNEKKVILRSSGGHVIILDDSPAGQTITVRSKAQQSIVLDDRTRSIELKGGERIFRMQGGQIQIL